MFCAGCLKRYAEQTLFGNGRALSTALSCMDSAGATPCAGTFPEHQLRRALPAKARSSQSSSSSCLVVVFIAAVFVVRRPSCLVAFRGADRVVSCAAHPRPSLGAGRRWCEKLTARCSGAKPRAVSRRGLLR